MKIGVVVLKAFRRSGQHFGKAFYSRSTRRKFRQPGKACIQLLHGLQKHSQAFVIEHSERSALVSLHCSLFALCCHVFLTATPCPIARRSSTGPTVPVASEIWRPSRPSICRFRPAWPFPCRAD